MNIGLVGLGLIGGSLGFDLKALQHHVIGVSRRPETCDRALERGAVDEASTHLSLVAQADVIFICTPIGLIQPTLEKLVPHLSSHSIVTDVGSVKAPVVEAAESVWPNFVGGHPMAGTAESGIDAALTHLFTDRPYVITPTSSTPPEAAEAVAELARSLQSRVYTCSPDDHDQAVAWISHLPVMVSASLLAACAREDNLQVYELAKTLASSGFRDTSRVGGGNPELGRMMAQYNRAALLRSLQGYQDQLTQVRSLVQNSQWDELENLLRKNQGDRPSYL
ncbi:MAG: prephenate/arogenate dehydrogenase [Elainellaceae cyanobacterium]